MIVLDEQLLGRGLERDIAQWYRGTVQFITDLRPHTIIKDETDKLSDLSFSQLQDVAAVAVFAYVKTLDDGSDQGGVFKKRRKGQ
jgi:hypothetical protein